MFALRQISNTFCLFRTKTVYWQQYKGHIIGIIGDEGLKIFNATRKLGTKDEEKIKYFHLWTFWRVVAMVIKVQQSWNSLDERHRIGRPHPDRMWLLIHTSCITKQDFISHVSLLSFKIRTNLIIFFFPSHHLDKVGNIGQSKFISFRMSNVVFLATCTLPTYF